MFPKIYKFIKFIEWYLRHNHGQIKIVSVITTMLVIGVEMIQQKFWNYNKLFTKTLKIRLT